jgi:two-component system, sensor histidine kinase and response regulator
MPETENDLRDILAAQKSNFLALISHELRTPMQSVYGLLELIQQKNSDPVMQEMIRAAQGSASLMLDLLDDILDFARLDADKLELEQLEVPLRTLIQGVVEALGIKIENRAITLKAVIDDNVPAVVIGDPKRLRQILYNLVANALKFTNAGSVTAHIGLTNNNMLKFSIIDTGMGIDGPAQEKLFQPFSQADTSTARKFGGSGLGLSICRKLVDLMHGQIGVTSTLGVGSTFWFTLPCVIANPDNLDPDLDLSGITILVVEDHPQGATEIERSLRNMNADVVIASTMAKAREFLQQQTFDVATIDYSLPDGYGLDLIRELSISATRTGLLMYTVHDHDGLEQTLAALGAIYVSKPASRQGLGQAIMDITRRSWHFAGHVQQKVLIAEDTESIRNMLMMQMEHINVDADIVPDGMVALEHLQKNKYGLMIADLHMPGVDGYKLIQRLRATENKDHRLPVIVLTADVHMAQRSTYMGHGFDDCLIKPFTFSHLKRVLQRWGIQIQEQDKITASSNGTTTLPDTRIDLPALITQMGMDRASVLSLLKKFPDMCEPLLNAITHAIAHDDLDAMGHAAHSLKGAARSACCDGLGALAAQLQNAAETRQPVEHLIGPLYTEFSAVCKYIEDLV